MKSNLNKVFAVTTLIILNAICANAQNAGQTIFNLEEKVQKEARIPTDVMAILKSDERVDQ